MGGYVLESHMLSEREDGRTWVTVLESHMLSEREDGEHG